MRHARTMEAKVKKEDLFSPQGHTDRPELPERPRRGPAPDADSLLRSPLGPYVLNRLPADLAAVTQGRSTYEQLAAEQCRVLRAAGAEDGPLATDPSTAPLVQLDLLFMLNGYLPAGPTAFPRPLLAALAAQCDRYPSLDPHMSYELLIDVNCAEWETTGHIRVFSDGDLGRLEGDFYLGHHLAEPAVRGAFDRVSSLVLEPHAVDPAAALEEARRGLDDFRRYMAQYGRLPREAFQAFRPYHMGHPGGARGASGAFMPSVQLLELALLAPTALYELYLDQSLAYFPAWSRPVVSEWRERSRDGGNLVQAVLDGRLKPDRRAAVALLGVIDTFVDFRMVHLGVTRKAIPEAFERSARPTRQSILAQGGERDFLGGAGPGDGRGDELGTSGFSVHHVLTNAVHRLLTARRRVAETLGPTVTE
ncbi:hypothetical protein OG399_44075 [Streptomyces achromogenes]|uniref:Uncharacterized protein n=1 Tax=Streptomyces achromogenes TaxID=67255 RepID=A0ABZ1L1B0_STRAH